MKSLGRNWEEEGRDKILVEGENFWEEMRDENFGEEMGRDENFGRKWEVKILRRGR